MLTVAPCSFAFLIFAVLLAFDAEVSEAEIRQLEICLGY